MDIVVASSRGRGLEGLLPSGTTLRWESSAGYQVLRNKALALLPPPNSQKERPHVYFLCGVCDITEKIGKKRDQYAECLFTKDSAHVIENIKNEIALCRSSVIRRGGLPIFATIPRLNLCIYNNSLLSKKYTKHLLHSDKYPEMQTQINEIIDKINIYICETNRNLEVSIPFLHTTIMKRSGKKGRTHYRYLWNLFEDGLHAGIELNKLWAESLTIAMGKNREKEQINDDEMRSPKRSWRQEKRPKLTH